MNRSYTTHSKMLHDKFSNTIVQPDLKLVETLHALLNVISDDNLAMMIDTVVADLIRCDNPPVRHQAAFMPELMRSSEGEE